METLSYNEEKSKRSELRYIIWPDIYGFISEAVIAVLILLLFNASNLSNRLLNDTSNNSNPFSYSFDLLTKLFSEIQKNYIFEQASIFLLWAVAGVLAYILIFRILQIVLGVNYSLSMGLKLVRKEHISGILHWLSSLHDFFLKILIVFAGVLVLFLGTFICFGIADQQLDAGLAYEFPSNLQPLALSFVGALLSLRFVVIGLILLSSHFRNWYVAP